MFKTVLWIAAACVAVLIALAVSRSLNFDRPAPPKPVAAPAAVIAAKPSPATTLAAPVAPEAPPPPPIADEQQVQDDAAATGMTTMEPEPDAPPTN